MERNRDFRRAAISTVNGLPRRRQRITTLKDSTDEDKQMELQETVRLRDRERLRKKDRDREFPKRRRVDKPSVQQMSGGGESFRENDSTDSSHEKYSDDEDEEEETSIRLQNRLNQLSPTSSSLSNNRRGLRTLRSSPVLRAAADEMLGVPIPRRARSSSAKRLHEYWNPGSGGYGEDLSNRRFSPYPPTVNLIGSGAASPAISGASMKKKMKSVEPKSRGLSGVSNSRPASVIQDDIEIEVAEALFDLMKQSQPESQYSPMQEKVDGDSTRTADDGLKRLKAEGDKDENNAFSVHNEQSIKVNAETIVVDSVKELKKEGRVEREKFPDDTAQEIMRGDGFVNKGKVGSPKEKESPSCVKVNACDIQDPTVTEAANAENLVEAKKETRLEIDLMAPPPLPSTPEREVLVEIGTDPKVMAQDVQKNCETAPKNGPLAASIHIQEEKVGVVGSNKLSNLDLEKCRHDMLSVSGNTTQLQARKEPKNQSPASMVPFPIGMSSWAGVLPHPGYMPALQAFLPVDGSARSSITMQHPQFKLSQPQPKRCATHQHIAQSIHSHQQLVKKSLSSGPTTSIPFYGTKSLNPRSMLPPTQKFIPGNPYLGEFQERQNLGTISGGIGKDKISDASTSEKSAIKQPSHQAPANNFLHGPGFIFPLGHHQTTMMAPANSSGPPQSASAVSNSSLPSNSAGKTSTNLPLPGGSALSFNHPMLTSNEAAASYMAILQNSGCPVPISTNITMPPFKGGTPTIPFFNSPFYSQMFNVQSASQSTSTFSVSSSHKQPPNQQQTSTKVNDNKAPTQTEKQFQSNKTGDPPQQSSKGRIDLMPRTFALSFGSNASTAQALNFSSMSQNPTVFQMLPDITRNGNQLQHQKNFQTSEGKFTPSSFSKSDYAAKFDGFNFLPSSLTGIQPFQSSAAGASVTTPNYQQQQLIQLQKNQMQQLTANSPFLPQWENFHRTPGAAPEGSSQSTTSTVVNIPQLKNTQGQTNITFGNSPASFQGQHIAMKSKAVSSSAPAQETENGSNPKSSPACRRNVPSILSTCPTQLSELKY